MTTYSVYIDTNCINANQKDKAINHLEKLYGEDKILIETTDTLETEFNEGKGYPKGKLKASNSYIYSYGPAVVGHSRIGFSIVGTDEDDKRLGKVLSIIFGQKNRKDYDRNEIRDCMHISTAIRYGGTHFVTYDKALLDKSEAIKNEFGIKIKKPADALKEILDRIEYEKTL